MLQGWLQASLKQNLHYRRENLHPGSVRSFPPGRRRLDCAPGRPTVTPPLCREKFFQMKKERATVRYSTAVDCSLCTRGSYDLYLL